MKLGSFENFYNTRHKGFMDVFLWYYVNIAFMKCHLIESLLRKFIDLFIRQQQSNAQLRMKLQFTKFQTGSSFTRGCHAVWPDDFSCCLMFGHLEQWKLAKWYKRFAKVGSKIWPAINKPTKSWLRVLIFCQSGGISSNLVTLMSCHAMKYMNKGVL